MRTKALMTTCLLFAAACGDIGIEPKEPLRLPVTGVERDVGLSVMDEAEEETYATPEAEPLPTTLPTVLQVDPEPETPELEPTPDPEVGGAGPQPIDDRPSFPLKKVRKRQRETGPRIELETAGSGEKALLRFKVEPGHTETVRVVTRLGIEGTVNKRKLPEVKLPAIALTMELRVLEVTDDGDIRYEMTTSKVELLETTGVNYRVKNAMEEQAKQLEGLRGTATISDRGVTRATDLKLGSHASKETRDMMEELETTLGQVSAPLPAEPVGEGAVWRVISTLKRKGAKLHQTATFRLLRRDEKKVSMLVNIEQSAGEQDVVTDELPKGASMTLVGATGKGFGRVVTAPNRLAPLAAKISANSDFSFSMSYRGRKEYMQLKMSIELELNSEQ